MKYHLIEIETNKKVFDGKTFEHRSDIWKFLQDYSKEETPDMEKVLTTYELEDFCDVHGWKLVAQK